MKNWCEHEFVALDNKDKIICQHCKMEAEEFFGKKFDTIEEFIQFKLNRILSINIKRIK